MMIDKSKQSSDMRLARVLLPAALLREVDELVLSGRGGYETRQEFFHEAIQNHVLEVKHGTGEGRQLQLDPDLVSPPGPSEHALAALNGTTATQSAPTAPAAEDGAPPATALPAALTDGPGIEAIHDLSQTALVAPDQGVTVDNGIARFKREPLLGLHNRDYPSLWAARQLAELSQHQVMPAPRFFELVTREAWRYAQSLADLEKTTKVKLTALFPSNINKPQSAEEGFRSFAIGTIPRKPSDDGTFETSGPFFQWQLAQLVKPNGTPHIGLTTAGYDLLRSLDGLTLAWPHEPEQAERFLGFLRDYAPWDWAGFEQVLVAVANSPNRAELTARFRQWQPTWSEAVANTNAAGFVARAREWGLIEPKLMEGRYVLTDFGQAMRERSGA
jgi:hypothetical protein